MLPFWNLQKLTIFFRTAKSTLAGSLKFPEVSLRCKTANIMRKSEKEVKTKTKMEGTC